MAKYLFLLAGMLHLLMVKYGDACCQPDVYTVGYSALVSEEFDDGPLVYFWESDGAHNRGGQIDASIVTISYDNGTIETTREIADYNTSTLWVITGIYCQKFKLDGQMSDGCIPDEAEYQGSDKAAFSDIPLEVGTWAWWDGEDNGNSLIGNISVTMLLYDCRPVQEMFFGRSKYNGKYYYTALSGTFHNFLYGILNPSKYFTVPQFCPKEYSSDVPVRLNSKHYRAFSPIDLLHKEFTNQPERVKPSPKPTPERVKPTPEPIQQENSRPRMKPGHYNFG